MINNQIKDNDSHDFYFTYHHSGGDSMSMMNPDEMDSNVAGIAGLIYLLADLDNPLPRDWKIFTFNDKNKFYNNFNAVLYL